MQRDEKIIVALTGCSHALSHGYLLIFPTVLLLLQKEFSIGYLELGVIGNIMTFTYGLGALPGGMIYNYLGPKKLYLFCFLGSAITVILVAVSSGLFLFTAGLALLGVLGSIYHPLANSMITSKVRGYGQALGIHGAAGNVGLASTPFVIGLIASYLGWRQAYLWSALPGIILSVWSFFVDMSPREETGTVKPTPTQKSTRCWRGPEQRWGSADDRRQRVRSAGGAVGVIVARDSGASPLLFSSERRAAAAGVMPFT